MSIFNPNAKSFNTPNSNPIWFVKVRIWMRLFDPIPNCLYFPTLPWLCNWFEWQRTFEIRTDSRLPLPTSQNKSWRRGKFKLHFLFASLAFISYLCTCCVSRSIPYPHRIPHPSGIFSKQFRIHLAHLSQCQRMPGHASSSSPVSSSRSPTPLHLHLE